jgi:murein DD-endopeptidase MepM/ murein hydrolase activator NlpD
MYDYFDSPFSRLRFFTAAVLVFAGLLVLPVLLNALWIKPTVAAANVNPTSSSISTGMEDSPNVITSGMFDAADGISKTSSSVSRSVSNGVETTTQSISSASAQSGKFIAHGAANSGSLVVHGVANSAASIGRGVGGGVGLVARGVGGTAKFTVNTTGRVFGIAVHPPTIGSIIKPADSVPVQTIGDGASTLPPDTGQTPKQAAGQTPPPPGADMTPAWPIHGTITTEFGVPHMPYQKYHTGIDISDGARAGVTPIHPFKPGRVVNVIHSNVSLGNHVIVDNGNGVTSVYGHMYSTNVQVGQQVDKNSVLGFEGSTGASTGVHVHFEIYLNGVLQNPHNFVSGRP